MNLSMHPLKSPSPPDFFDTEPRVGWRVWHASLEDGTLSSPAHHDQVWPGCARAEASCMRTRTPQHEAPFRHCECGIYAFEIGLQARAMYDMVVEHWEWFCRDGYFPVYGQVSLWGRVLRHEYGWRGRYAYPYMLRAPAKNLADMLSERYRVDVECEA